MTRAQIRDRILNALNESTSSPVFWSTAQIDAVIDEAAEVLAEEAKAIRRTGLLARQDGTIYYSTRAIGSDLMAIMRIWLPDLNRRLIPVTIAELDAFHETWPTVTGDPEYWFPVSWDLFGVYPHPATGGGMFRVDYAAWPRALLDDNDEPEFREADHDGMVLYGVYDGLMKQWAGQRAMELYTKFLESWGASRARAGVREVQSRYYQRGMAPGRGFPSGVSR